MANINHVFGVIFIISGAVSSNNITQDLLQSVKSCDVGDVSENECTKCICNSNSVYACTPLNCTNNHKEKAKESNILKDLQMPSKQQKCNPNMVYVQNSVTCICNKKGFWPHKQCDEMFNSLSPGNTTKQKCEPNTYVTIDCNVCRCSLSGNINRDRCTTNVCDKHEFTNSRRGQSSSLVYGRCEPANWYSIAPCQFCFCANKNSLICNNGHQNKNKMDLGPYSFTVCGKKVIHGAIDLIPQNKDKLMLREGQEHHYKRKKIRSSVPKLKAQNKLKETNDVTIGISKDNNIQKDDNEKQQAGYYSQLEEDKQDTTLGKPVSRNRDFTQMPFEDEDSIENENDYHRNDVNLNEESDSENDIAIEFLRSDSTQKDIVTTPLEAGDIVYSLPIEKNISKKKNAPLKDPLKTFSRTLRISLPIVLDKVFKMALRKSMVSLKPDSNCEPGTSSYVKCNMCFCMKNKKLLCTKNSC